VKCMEAVLHTVYQISISHVSFSPWNEVLFEKLIVAQLAKEFPVGSVHCLKGSSVGPYFDLNESCPHSSMVLTLNTSPPFSVLTTIVWPHTPAVWPEYLYFPIFVSLLKICMRYWLQVCTIRLSHVCSNFSDCSALCKT